MPTARSLRPFSELRCGQCGQVVPHRDVEVRQFATAAWPRCCGRDMTLNRRGFRGHTTDGGSDPSCAGPAVGV
jgi:hypothetical protein